MINIWLDLRNKEKENVFKFKDKTIKVGKYKVF